MLFRYKGFDSNGLKIKSKLEASSLTEAKAKLKAKGIMYTSLDEGSFNLSSKIILKRRKNLDTLSLSYISRDLSMYLNSGVSLITSIDLLKQRYKNNRKLYDFFESISTFLDEGKNFYTALDSQDVIKIPEFYKQSIKVSENGGLLQRVLLELSSFLKEQDRIYKQVKSAMIYPLFILCVSVLMLGFMLSFIVPKISEIFAQIDQELPAITKFIVSIGEFFSNNYLLILLSIILSIGTFIFMLNKLNSFRYFIHKLLLKVPFFSTLIEQAELARFSYMNSILIKSGVPIVQSINLSANILKNEVIKKVFLEASNSVVEGKKLSLLLSSNKIYKIDESFIHSISIGEDTSRLDEILSNLAVLYQESNKDKTDVFLSLLEPILMLFVGLTIGLIVLSMLLPIFSMNLG